MSRSCQTLGVMKPEVRVIEAYVHNGRVGVLVELALETSFTAAMAEFKQLARDLAVQVAAAPIASVEVLVEQSFVKDPSMLVAQLIAKASRHLGEQIVVTRFVRWEVEAGAPFSPEPTPTAAAAAGLSRSRNNAA